MGEALGTSLAADTARRYLVYCYTHARLFGMLFAVKISASASKIKKKKLHSLSLQKKHYPRRYCRVEKKELFCNLSTFK